ncbi:MAG: glycosyltransferase family 1 protein [bacterium]
MFVAVDATAVRSHHHGVGTYVANILESLVRTERANRYHVYMTRTGLTNTNLGRLAPGRLRVTPVTGWRPLRILWEQYLMAADARRRGADVIWGCHNSLPRSHCIPRVVTVHDLGVFAVPRYYPALKAVYFRRALSQAVATADMVLPVSRFTANELENRLKVPPARIRVVANGVSKHFCPVRSPDRIAAARARYSLPNRFVLTVGVPEPKKNLLGILAAWRLLEQQGRKPPVLVVGGGRSYGWQNRDIYRAVAELGDRVLTTDFITVSDLPAVYSLADCFVFPSFYEGFGLPPLEAMACGTPVIVSNAASMPEVIGDAGLLVEPSDVAGLATAVSRLLSDAVLRAELSARGIARAARWQWDDSARRLLDVFHEVAGQ